MAASQPRAAALPIGRRQDTSTRQVCNRFSDTEILEPLRIAREVTIRKGQPNMVYVLPRTSSRTRAQAHNTAVGLGSKFCRQRKPHVSSSRLDDDEKEVAIAEDKEVVVHDGKEAVTAPVGHSSHVKLSRCCGVSSSALMDVTWRKGVAKAHGLSFVLERWENRVLVYPARHFVESWL